MRGLFLRPIGSPSPGGSTLGSASSNDEDNFFGPVSVNFIRPGWLSDSAVSDDNHDVTMDSTAFSMHYRSLAMSESGIDLKTPTGGKLFFERRHQLIQIKGLPFLGFADYLLKRGVGSYHPCPQCTGATHERS